MKLLHSVMANKKSSFQDQQNYIIQQKLTVIISRFASFQRAMRINQSPRCQQWKNSPPQLFLRTEIGVICVFVQVLHCRLTRKNHDQISSRMICQCWTHIHHFLVLQFWTHLKIIRSQEYMLRKRKLQITTLGYILAKH